MWRDERLSEVEIFWDGVSKYRNDIRQADRKKCGTDLRNIQMEKWVLTGVNIYRPINAWKRGGPLVICTTTGALKDNNSDTRRES